MDKFLQTVKEHEGFSSSVMQDSLGYWTIGFGCCVDKRKSCGLTEEQASYILNSQLSDAELELSHLPWFLLLDIVRQDVLIELCFNIGLDGVLEFKQMIASLENKDYSAASMHLLNSLWAKQVKSGRADNMASRLKDGVYAS
jgi:lysozyme